MSDSTAVGTSNWEEWTDRVSSWQDMTSDIPKLVREDIHKARMMPQEAARGMKSLMTDPLSVQYAMGYKDRKYSLTYDVLKRIPHQLSMVGAIINTRVNQVASFSVPYRASKSVGFVIKHKDPSHLTSKSEQKFIQDLEKFIYHCGHPEPNPYNNKKRDDFETFLKKVVRDSLIFDQLCVELVPDRRGIPYEFIAADAATIRMASPNSANMSPFSNSHSRDPAYSGRLLHYMNRTSDERGSPYRSVQLYDQDDKPAFVQVMNGQIENVYTEDEMIFGVRNPRTDVYIQGYGYSELEQLITIITSHLYAEEYNRRFFMQGCVAGDTPVYTEDGILPIVDLVGSQFNVWNGEEFVKADAVYSGFKRAFRTRLQNDHEITTSYDHKFLTFDSDGNTCMVPISELGVGDYVAQPDELVNFDSIDSVQVPRTIHHQVPVVETGALDSDFYEFVGWLVGDGYISCRPRSQYTNKKSYTVSCVFGPKDKDAFRKFTKMLDDRGIKYHLRKSGGFWGGSKIDCLTIRNKGLFEFLRDTVGMSEKKSHNKTVPIRVFSESVEHRSAFLRGLFSADGFIKKGYQAHFCSSSRELVDGVQHILWSLGVHSNLSHTLKNKSGRNCYYLRVSNNQLFNARIGFLLDYKKQKCNKRDSLGKVPRSLQKAIYARLYGKPLPSNRWLTRRDLHRLTKNNNMEFEVLKYRWTEIQSVTDVGVDIPTYDIRQTHYKHQWSTGGCIVSNSAPKGILNFKGDSMTPDMLEGFRRQWRASLEGVENSWKTPILQSEQGIDWVDLHPSNREMEYNAWIEYLIKITCAIFLMDPAELNFDLHGGVQQTPLFESSQEWKLKASRDRGLKPLLRFIAKLINDNIISKIDDHFMFDFVGLDELTEQEKHTLRTEQVASYMTLNEIRRADDRHDLEYGDIPMNPTYIQAMQIKQQMEQQQQQQEQQQQMAAQQAQAPGTSPEEGTGMGPVGGPEEGEGDKSPQYSERFGKSLEARSGEKFLEIDLDLDSWKDDVRKD